MPKSWKSVLLLNGAAFVGFAAESEYAPVLRIWLSADIMIDAQKICQEHPSDLRLQFYFETPSDCNIIDLDIFGKGSRNYRCIVK